MAVLAVIVVAAPLAYADAGKWYEEKIAEINQKYGLPTYPNDLPDTMRADYEAEMLPVYKSHDKVMVMLDAIYKKQQKISDQIDEIDKQYGYAVTWPEHDEATWAKYNSEIELAYVQFQKQLSAIGVRYDIPQTPQLTDQQQKSYAEKTEKLHFQINEINKQAEDLVKEMDMYNAKIAEIDKKYGIAHSDMGSWDWDMYNAELESAQKEYTKKYEAQMLRHKDLQKLYDQHYEMQREFDIYGRHGAANMPGATQQFVAEVIALEEKYAKQDIADAEKMYAVISGQMIPELQDIYKKYGHSPPDSMTAEQVGKQDQKRKDLLEQIQKMETELGVSQYMKLVK